MPLLLLLLGCVYDVGGIAVVAAPDVTAVLGDFVANIGDDRIVLIESDDPTRTARRYSDAVAVTIEATGSLAPECYALRSDTTKSADAGFHAVGGDVLGAQYALADALEQRGYGFYHPEETVIPADLAASPWSPARWDSAVHCPEQSVRGLDPHTLHPIEFMQDAWMPSADGLNRAERVVDWLVKNRGNQLQWPALGNILDSSADAAAWADHTGALVDYAHARGVQTAIGVQLFGGANLQEAFDLIEDPDASEEARRAEIDQRLRVLLKPSGGSVIAFDKVNLSFGEFSGESPEVFIDNVNLFVDVLRGIADEDGRTIEPDATIHVGADQTITYNDEEILYYFLVKYADPSIVPYIHTVMYYTLFDDAGGAYGHDDFSEHRQYLQDRMDADQPVAYFPESAYWCAFDDSVPLYLPVYIKSRYDDMRALADAGYALDQHVTFSSGWEWGYWQTDVAVLRMGWSLPQTWEDAVRADFPALPSATQDAIIALAELQEQALIVGRLAPWMAGRDAFMDIGRSAGIVAQPDRPKFDEIVAMSVEDRAGFQDTVVAPLRQLGVDTRALLGPVQAAPTGLEDGAEGETPWQREVADGIEIDALRAEYMAAVLDAVLAYADGDAAAAAEHITTAETTFTAAQAVVARRHADLHDPDPARLTGLLENPTLYDYGYLRHADTLCFWQRDDAQVRNLVLGESNVDPGCAFD